MHFVIIDTKKNKGFTWFGELLCQNTAQTNGFSAFGVSIQLNTYSISFENEPHHGSELSGAGLG